MNASKTTLVAILANQTWVDMIVAAHVVPTQRLWIWWVWTGWRVLCVGMGSAQLCMHHGML
jgi:hypothetical protein